MCSKWTGREPNPLSLDQIRFANTIFVSYQKILHACTTSTCITSANIPSGFKVPWKIRIVRYLRANKWHSFKHIDLSNGMIFPNIYLWSSILLLVQSFQDRTFSPRSYFSTKISIVKVSSLRGIQITFPFDRFSGQSVFVSFQIINPIFSCIHLSLTLDWWNRIRWHRISLLDVISTFDYSRKVLDHSHLFIIKWNGNFFLVVKDTSV